ncbi:unnamed protein product [Caenorhabditis nigoni]
MKICSLFPRASIAKGKKPQGQFRFQPDLVQEISGCQNLRSYPTIVEESGSPVCGHSRRGCAAQQLPNTTKPRSDETRHYVFLERRKTSESDMQGGRSARCRRIRRRLEEECSEKLVFKNQ